jgi:hypothetical protein
MMMIVVVEMASMGVAPPSPNLPRALIRRDGFAPKPGSFGIREECAGQDARRKARGQ